MKKNDTVVRGSSLGFKERKMRWFLLAALASFGTATAYADGTNTMHGSACKAMSPTAEVGYGSELWNGGSTAIHVTCPLNVAWGGGADVPFQMKGAIIHFGSNAAPSEIACEMVRQHDNGEVLETKHASVAWFIGIDTAWRKGVVFTHFIADADARHHQYMIFCTLPPLSALYSVSYQTLACPSRDPKWCLSQGGAPR
jgi:hypothetical protein